MALAAAVLDLQARTDREAREQVATVLHMTAQHMQLVVVVVRLAFLRHLAEVLTPITTTAATAAALLVRLQQGIRAAVAAVRDQTLSLETRVAEPDRRVL
jgi:hypothetical protein